MSRQHARTPYIAYLNDVRRHTLVTPAEELELCRAVRAGDHAARQRMVEANLRLVLRIANHYQRSNLPLEDMVSEGNLGLMHALEKFDPERGFRFCTYAVYWIRQYIEQAIACQSRTVRIPVHVTKRLNRCLRARRTLQQQGYREPRSADLATATGLSVREVEALLPWHEPALSLDAPLESGSWQDRLTDDTQPLPDGQISDADLLATVRSWILHLDPRTQEILSRRFGLSDDAETFDAIAQDIGVTRERVRQILLDACFHLKERLQEDGLSVMDVFGG